MFETQSLFDFWGRAHNVSDRNLLELFSQLGDPSKPRSVGHTFSGIVVLTRFGMQARFREQKVLVRGKMVHWDFLREPLGFDLEKPLYARTKQTSPQTSDENVLACWPRT